MTTSYTFYFVDQKEGRAPNTLAELVTYARRHYPDIPFESIRFELGIVSITLSALKTTTVAVKKQRDSKNPR